LKFTFPCQKQSDIVIEVYPNNSLFCAFIYPLMKSWLTFGRQNMEGNWISQVYCMR
jgi:hypothetical protein